MADKGLLRETGRVEEALPATNFRVRLESGDEVLALGADKTALRVRRNGKTKHQQQGDQQTHDGTVTAD